MKLRHLVVGIILVVVTIGAVAALQLMRSGLTPDVPYTAASTVSATGTPAAQTTALNTALLSDDADAVTEIRVSDGSADYILSRTGDGWQLSEPQLADVNQTLINQTVYSLMHLRGTVQETVPEAQLAALGEPRFQIAYQMADGQERLLHLIQMTDRRTDCLAMWRGEETVWQITGSFDLMCRKSYDFLNRRLIAIPVEAVSAVQISRPADGLELEAVRITSPERLHAVRDSLQTAPETSPASDGAALPEDADSDSAPEKPREPTATTLNGGDATPVPVPSGPAPTSDSENPSASKSETGPEPAAGSAWPSISLPSGSSPTDAPPAYFELKTSAQPADWQLIRPIDIHGNSYNLSALIQEAASLNAVRFVALGDHSLDLYGLDAPRLTYVLQGLDTTGTLQTESILLGNRLVNDTVYGYSSRLDAVFICNAGSFRLGDTPLLDLIDRFPVRVPLQSIRTMDIQTPLREAVVSIQAEAAGPDADIRYWYNGAPADWTDAAGRSLVRQLYRSVAGIRIAGLDVEAPPESDIDYRIVLYLHSDGDAEADPLVLELQNRSEDSLYIFMNGRYTGAYCSRQVLIEDEVGNYGMLLALEQLDKRWNHAAEE